MGEYICMLYLVLYTDSDSVCLLPRSSHIHVLQTELKLVTYLHRLKIPHHIRTSNLAAPLEH